MARFDFSQIEEIRLSEGAHVSASDGVCFMEAIAFFAGEPHSDRPACACPVLTSYGIGLNDRMPDDVRNRMLRPLVPMVAGTRDEDSKQKRAEFLAMWAVNKVLPIVLRARGLADHAEACEKAGTLNAAANAAYAATTAATTAANAAANAAAYAANAAAYAAAYAAYAADAANAAAYAAYAADAAAYAADAANAAAYAAAKAAADAADAYAAAEIWAVAVEGLRQAILIGRHDGFGIAEPVLAERFARLRALVDAA